jgi:TolA-binding protein
LTLNPRHTDAHYWLGVMLYKEGHFDQTITHLTVVVTNDPTRAWAFYYRGLAYRKLGQAAEAKTDLQQVTALAPGTPLADLAQRMLKKLP